MKLHSDGATVAVDLDAKGWTVPAERMKMGVKHDVPLSEAVELLRGQLALRRDPSP